MEPGDYYAQRGYVAEDYIGLEDKLERQRLVDAVVEAAVATRRARLNHESAVKRWILRGTPVTTGSSVSDAEEAEAAAVDALEEHDARS